MFRGKKLKILVSRRSPLRKSSQSVWVFLTLIERRQRGDQLGVRGGGNGYWDFLTPIESAPTPENIPESSSNRMLLQMLAEHLSSSLLLDLGTSYPCCSVNSVTMIGFDINNGKRAIVLADSILSVHHNIHVLFT